MVLRALTTSTVGVCALLTWSGAAMAEDRSAGPSFSCDHAELVDERIICADPLLRQADGALGQKYAALLASADPARHNALKADERAWVERRDRECGVTRSTRVTDAARPGYIDCFLAAYDERATDLTAMAADPTRDPGEISTPLRRSQFATAGAGDTVDPSHPIGLETTETERILLAWRGDGSLIVLGHLPDRRNVGLYAWRHGQAPTLLTDAVADPDRIERLCIQGDTILLIPRADPAMPVEQFVAGSLQLVSRHKVAPALAAACGLDARRVLVGGTPGGPLLDLGPTGSGSTDPTDRFVALRLDAAVRRVEPAVRIDRSVPFRATYLAFADQFIVAPSAGQERRWAKTDCLPYWQITPASGKAERFCVRFGPYAAAAPHPLPTKAGRFDAGGPTGLYRIDGDNPVITVPGPVAGAAVSPDGCTIAYAGAVDEKAKPRGGRFIRVLTVCTP